MEVHHHRSLADIFQAMLSLLRLVELRVVEREKQLALSTHLLEVKTIATPCAALNQKGGTRARYLQNSHLSAGVGIAWRASSELNSYSGVAAKTVSFEAALGANVARR